AGNANCQGRRPSAQSTRKMPPATRYTCAATSQCSGIAETSLATLSARTTAMAATASGISKPNNTVGTAVSAAAKYVFAAPKYWATANQPMSAADSTPAVT